MRLDRTGNSSIAKSYHGKSAFSKSGKARRVPHFGYPVSRDPYAESSSWWFWAESLTNRMSLEGYETVFRYVPTQLQQQFIRLP